MARVELYAHTSLRGIAAALVLFLHCRQLPYAGPEYRPLTTFLFSSYLCVDLFFMLSGFILVYTHARDFRGAKATPANTARFMKRRFFRIYPNYLLWFLAALLVSFTLELAQTGRIDFSAPVQISLLLHVFMVQHLFEAPIFWNWALWSIAVEMIAYAFFVPILVLRRRADPIRADLLILALCFLSYALIEARYGGLLIAQGFPPALRCLTGFALGMVLAGHRRRLAGLSESTISRLQVSSVVGAAVGFYFNIDIFVMACFAVLVFSCGVNRGVLGLILKNPFLRFAGKLSFSLYLAHYPIIWIWEVLSPFLERATSVPFRNNWVLFSIVVLGLTLAVSAAAFRGFERPVQRWLVARF